MSTPSAFSLGLIAQALWSFLRTPIRFGGASQSEVVVLISELKAQREQYHLLMTNHVAHLDENLKANAEALREAVSVLRGVAEGLKSHEERSRQAADDIRIRIATIEGRLR